MSSPESRVVELAGKGRLEVENLLDLALIGDAETANFLRDLREEWVRQGEIGLYNATFQSWALVVELYLRDGYSGLSSLSKGGGAQFVISLLEHLHSEDSLKALMHLYSEVIDEPEVNVEISDKLVASLNSMLSFPPIIDVDIASKDCLRGFIHRYMGFVIDDGKYATAMCALRSIGDETSIDLIKSKKPLTGSWSGTEKMVIKSIKNNIVR